MLLYLPYQYASEDIVEIDNDAAGKFYVTILEPRSDLSEGDYMTVTGLVNGISLGEVQLDNSNISATGGEPAQLFEQGKQDIQTSLEKLLRELNYQSRILSQGAKKCGMKTLYFLTVTLKVSM